MSCPVCGAQNEASAAFCYRCGSALKPADPATGRTVNLGRADTPAFGTPAPQPQDDSGARVYDLPPRPAAAQPQDDSSARVYDLPPSPARPGPALAPASADRLPPNVVSGPPVPQFSVPQYTPPEGVSGTVIMPQRPTSNTALISMILGIVSLGMFTLLLCTFFLMPFSVVFGIPAVILAYNARKEIRASGGQLGGEGMAKAGLIMGWINIALSVLAAVGICSFFVFAAAQS